MKGLCLVMVLLTACATTPRKPPCEGPLRPINRADVLQPAAVPRVAPLKMPRPKESRR